MKAVKKKYLASKEAEESSDEESVTSSKDSKLELQFLNVAEIETHLKAFEPLKECPEDLISELALELHR